MYFFYRKANFQSIKAGFPANSISSNIIWIKDTKTSRLFVCVKFYESHKSNKIFIKTIVIKLDGVDNRPSTDKLHHFVQ